VFEKEGGLMKTKPMQQGGGCKSHSTWILQELGSEGGGGKNNLE
jgi:hypothetical protein